MFMIMIGTFILIIFTVIFSELYQDNLADKKNIIMQDFGYSIQNEVIIASNTRSGYVRQFEIPVKLEGFDYSIYVVNSVLILNYTDNVAAFAIPAVDGSFIKGTNTIQNINNTICLNC